MRSILLMVVASVLLAVGGAGAQVPPARRRPNILFVMTDQQRWDSLGANGNRVVKTPNFDRFASAGANFTHAFVQAPVCVPSRASFFTGRYPHAHRNRVNYTPLDPSETLLQARLKAAGYATAAVGKLHYTPPTPEEARRSGFDAVELHDGVEMTDPWSDYVAWRREHDPLKDVPYRALAKDIASGKNPFRAALSAEHTDTAWVGSRTRHRLRELAASNRPWFLYASFWKPHEPFEVPEPYASMYDGVEFPLPDRTTEEDVRTLPPPLQKLILRGGTGVLTTPRERLQWILRSYHGSIAHVDTEVGAILGVLRELHLEEDTIVVFSSDHGDQLHEHGIQGKNCFFEASVRVPFMISWPGRVKAGRRDELVESVDLLPTLFDLAGLPEPREFQGRSLAPLISDGGRPYAPREAVFSENVIPEVITAGKLDLQFDKGKGVDGIRHPDAKMVRTRKWKYVYYPEGFAELYDLEADPGERRNLAGKADMRDTESEMKDRLLHWLTTAAETDQIAPRWTLPGKGSKK
jgi:arylsulfatase